MGPKDTYKGDSWQKLYTRTSFWYNALDSLGPKYFFERKHLILASREGADVAMLRSFGVQDKNIIACDRSSEACEAFSKKFPDVPIFCEDVANTARRFRHQFASCFLDFCGPLSERSIKTTKSVILNGLTDGTYFGLCHQKGRESGKMANLLIDIRDSRMSGFLDLPKGNDPTVNRTFSVYVSLVYPLIPMNVGLVQNFSVTYRSKTEDSIGSPMIVLGFRVHRAPTGRSNKAFVRSYLSEMMEAEFNQRDVSKMSDDQILELINAEFEDD